MWYEADVELIDAPISFIWVKKYSSCTHTTNGLEYGIISDIDDTIVKTTATDFLAMAKTPFLQRPYTTSIRWRFRILQISSVRKKW